MRRLFILLSFSLSALAADASGVLQNVSDTIVSLDGFRDGIHHWNLEHPQRNYPRYAPSQYREIADNLLAYQNADGGWPKNIDWLAVLPADSVKAALRERYRRSTLDNRNTFPQIEYLGDVYSLTSDLRYHDFTDWGSRIFLIDIGHYESEACSRDILSHVIARALPVLPVLVSRSQRNPIFYI